MMNFSRVHIVMPSCARPSGKEGLVITSGAAIVRLDSALTMKFTATFYSFSPAMGRFGGVSSITLRMWADQTGQVTPKFHCSYSNGPGCGG
jgi:hypothetical protein